MDLACLNSSRRPLCLGWRGQGERCPDLPCPRPGLVTEKTLGVWGPPPPGTRTLFSPLELTRQPSENVPQTAAQPLCASAWKKRTVNATLRERGTMSSVCHGPEVRRLLPAPGQAGVHRRAGHTGWHCKAPVWKAPWKLAAPGKLRQAVHLGSPVAGPEVVSTPDC